MAFVGLRAVVAEEAWKTCVRGGYPALSGFRTARHFMSSGESYAVSITQVLLRVPSVAVWLDKHAAHCGVAATEDERMEGCATCALRCSRHALAHAGGPGLKRKAPVLVSRRALAGQKFAGTGERDVVDFLTGLLDAMRAVEVAEAAWMYVSSMVLWMCGCCPRA